MRLLEHQSKKLLSGFGLWVGHSTVVDSVEAAADVVAQLGIPAVLKAQVPFGGRGKAGAVRFIDTVEDAEQAARQLLGMEIRGVKVQTISVEPKLSFSREFYAGVTWDTSAKLSIVLLSASGGINVESSHGLITRRTFDPAVGLHAYEGREMAAEIGLTGKVLIGVGTVLSKLVQAFITLDAVTVEVNPFVEVDEMLIALDAHVEIDDDAAYRQKARLEPLGEITPSSAGRPPTSLELKAQSIDAMDHRGVAGRVVEFDGDLGLLIGGGGASLTVFDAIRRYGGNPANYCEVGGNPTEEKVAALTQLLLLKAGVRKLAVIMNVVNNTRADVMARGVLMGVERAGLNPAETICVFRIPGSWEQEARELLGASGVEALGREVSLDACARLAVERMRQKG